MKFFTLTEITYIVFRKYTLNIAVVLKRFAVLGMLFYLSHQIAMAQSVHIPDPGLRAALELALGKQADEDITQVEMASLESLDALETGIRNIRGLEFAVNLTELHLGRNRISDLSPLEGLKNLSVLDLHQNGEVASLKSTQDALINLTWLSLSENRITDVTPAQRLIQSKIPCS